MIMERYVAQSRLRDLIDDNNQLLLVISRFAIPFGFGDHTVREVCESHGVDCPTFLAVANFISNHPVAPHSLSPLSLIGYLRRAHTYFLDYNLPMIRRKLVDALYQSNVSDITFLILKYFDDYALEVRAHMEFENDVLFPYVEGLAEGHADSDFRLEEYSSTHEDMSQKLNELKDIIIRHYEQHDNDLLNSVLYDIINCQDDLITHCGVENALLVPAVRLMEHGEGGESYDEAESIAEQRDGDDTGSSADSPEASSDQLSNREKEIVALVAKGLTNKEIANQLFLSVHTVTTHRRNIASKLQIHSQAGLTIYAILNHLISLDDIRLSK